MILFYKKDRFKGLLTARAQALFFAAIFMMFAAVGLLISHGFAAGEFGRTIRWTVYYGLIAVGWAWSFSKDTRLLLVVIPVSFVAPWFIGPGHMTFDEVMVTVLIITGFILFMIFTTLEWPRSLRLQTEIGLARELHSRLVPAIDRKTKGLEIYGTSSACNEVGGDLFDLVEFDSAVDLYLADVSGHGIAAGTLMGMTKSAIRMRVQDRPSLGELIEDLHRVITEVAKAGMFVTFAVLRVKEKNSVEYGLAGHLPILHFRPSTGDFDYLGEPSLPLGAPMGQHKTAPSTGCVDVEPSDLFLLLTDGLTEVLDQHNNELGLEPIEIIIRRFHDEHLSTLHDRIIRLVEGHGPQKDDQTLLLARVLK